MRSIGKQWISLSQALKQAEPYVNANDLKMSKLFSFPCPHLGNFAALVELSSRLRSSQCVAVKKADSMRIINGTVVFSVTVARSNIIECLLCVRFYVSRDVKCLKILKPQGKNGGGDGMPYLFSYNIIS